MSISVIQQHQQQSTNSVVLPPQIVDNTPKNIEIQNIGGLEYLKTIENNSIN